MSSDLPSPQAKPLIAVTGASGFIGSGVAKAFRRAGYRVYGLVRSQEKAQELLKHEIIPVVGDLSKPETYREQVKRAAIIVDNVADFSETDLFAANKLLLKTVAEESGEGLQGKKTFIYTSGILVYGDHPNEVIDETTPVPDTKLNKWRVSVEKAVLTETKVNGVVLRPGYLYGHSGSWSAPYFEVSGDTLVIKGNKSRRWSWIHLDDLTEAYVLAARHIQVSKGQIFNIVSNSSPTNEEIQVKAAQLAGFKGKVEYQQRDADAYSEYSDVTIVANPQKAIDLLHWQPRHVGIIEELEIYYEAVKAHKHQPHQTA